MLEIRPQLKYAMLHNIDTLGADLDPSWLGRHIENGACLSVEVMERRLEDRGGGLARVSGRPRLVEGLALPREEDEAKLSYYNSLTTFISIDPLLGHFGLTRADLHNQRAVRPRRASPRAALANLHHAERSQASLGQRAGRRVSSHPVREVVGRHEHAADVSVAFFCVPRARGQQLKDVAQLDGWLRDGSKDYVESLCDFG